MSVLSIFSLQGRVAVVTGASSGIGREIATTLALAGASVVAVARRAQELELMCDAIAQQGGRASAVTVDLADKARIDDFAELAGDPFGVPDILVCAAGINPRKPIGDIDITNWERTLHLNLAVPFFLAQQLAPGMMDKGWGRIINIASLQAIRPLPNGAPYGASKGGIMQLTRAQAEAWSRRGINVNALAPGFFPTELTAPLVKDSQRWAAFGDRTLCGRNGKLEDLRGASIFLASRASDFVTGQTIFVDGGWSAAS